MQNFTEIGSPIFGGQIGELLVCFTYKHTDTHTNNFFHLAYRSQIWTELNALTLIIGLRGFSSFSKRIRVDAEKIY